MIKKLNKYINLSIVLSILLMILGMIIIIYPAMSLKVFSYGISIISIIFGIYLLIEDFRLKNYWLVFDFSLVGIVFLLLGVILLLYPNVLTTLIPIFLGIWFIISSIFKLKLTSLLSSCNNSIYMTSILMSMLSIICGILFIISPLNGAFAIALLIGILLFVYSLSDIVDMIIFKKNINEMHKYLKNKIIIN